MTLLENVDAEDEDAALAIWQDSNDHRSVHFVNRSCEWVELKGTLKMSGNREMSSIARIPPKATYTHRFLGSSSRKKAWRSQNTTIEA